MMLLRLALVLTMILIKTINGNLGLTALGRCIMSEASTGNRAEQIAMGFACQRNANHASNKFPIASVTRIAQDIHAGRISDPTQGANRWYSPNLMPKENERFKCKSPIGSGNIDCNGGLENICANMKNYKPSWAVEKKFISIKDVRSCYFKFYKI